MGTCRRDWLDCNTIKKFCIAVVLHLCGTLFNRQFYAFASLPDGIIIRRADKRVTASLQRNAGRRTAVAKETVAKTMSPPAQDVGHAPSSDCVRQGFRASLPRRLSAAVTDGRTPDSVPSNWPPACEASPSMSFMTDRATSALAAAVTTNRLRVSS